MLVVWKGGDIVKKLTKKNTESFNKVEAYKRKQCTCYCWNCGCWTGNKAGDKKTAKTLQTNGAGTY